MKAALLALAFVLAVGASAPAVSPKTVPDAPDDMGGYEDRQGQALHFMVRGVLGGHIWGTEVYTADSSVATAAVHAGAVKPGEKKEVAILLLPGQASYRGSTRNGVTTGDYGAYRASYRFLKPGEAEPDPSDGTHPLATVDNLMAFKSRVGDTLLFKVTGAAVGNVWGTGVYTADSSLAAAAVHAGLVEPGETANLRVTMLPGQDRYRGTESNGVRSADYAGFELSFRFEPKQRGSSGASGAAKTQPTDKGIPPH